MASSLFAEDVLGKVCWDKAAKVSYFQTLLGSTWCMTTINPHLTIAK